MTPIRHKRTLILAGLLALCVCALRPVLAGLPSAPSTTYVPNSVPVVKAQDLNDLQKYLAGLYSALFTVKALDVDGTGGNAAGAAAGTVRVSSTVSAYSTTDPFAMPTVPVGQLSREHMILGAVRCFISGGTLSQCGGFNVRSVERLLLGGYRVTLNTAGANQFRHVAVVTPESSATLLVVVRGLGIDAGGVYVTFVFRDLSGAPVDPSAFNVMVTGG